MAPYLRRPQPATAPRPASGDADQTPLGHEGRDITTIILLGIKSRGRRGVGTQTALFRPS